MRFEEFFRKATGYEPYPWQQRVATEGLPELVDVETGAGKTAGIVLPWLYRRTTHAAATPAWLVVALPMRTLVDQVVGDVARWIDNLGRSAKASRSAAPCSSTWMSASVDRKGAVLACVSRANEHSTRLWAYRGEPSLAFRHLEEPQTVRRPTWR